ncbi:hypothetical protein J8273_8895 [Carpediemonas membranifera]|uniref:Uncharacterized protein n=1 Tax=Carpediemonas membranifera TaxID=201153 RepID=A0A8J6E0P3_9EUKA|nr:hypothetical protein J8273_8895 [Carpediemonas membranifera]|eukprot:KAG9389602.1 hypothetical protein J8273_8895 [Carpediemonas membranifera]
MLSRIPPLKPAAQVLLDRARSILTDGPPLSMNVELDDGEELPVALHTLLQGTLWATLLESGADPDLSMDSYGANEQGLHYKLKDKFPWFLCRKFLFAHNVAQKDGETYRGPEYLHSLYAGRLFTAFTDESTRLRLARIPRVIRVVDDGLTFIAQTPKGLFGWGVDFVRQLGMDSSDRIDHPTRLTFPQCTKVGDCERGLGAWRKNDLVKQIWMRHGRTIIHTPVGLIMAGQFSKWFVGDVDNDTFFHQISLPAGFVPDHIIQDVECVTILESGSHQLITGQNTCGQLGLGHAYGMSGFEPLPFRVDRVISAHPGSIFSLFLSGETVLFSGLTPAVLASSGLLPGFGEGDYCPTPTPLYFTSPINAMYCDEFDLVWVSAGLSHFVTDQGMAVCLPFEVCRCCSYEWVCDTAGIWYRVPGDGVGVTVADEDEIEDEIVDLVPVAVGPGWV